MQGLLFFITLIHLLKDSAAQAPGNGGGGSCTQFCVQVDGCISGKMLVEEKFKGNVSVSQLSEGDFIRGITGAEQKFSWCRVEAIFQVPNSSNETTYDGFTANHMVINDTVRPYGNKGEVQVGPIYTLATDCDASVNSAGQAFTPISSTFCPHELSWSEYLSVITAVRRFTNQAGNFWYDMNSYHDNDTAVVPRWVDELPIICREVLLCSREDKCQAFENVMNEFVHDHLNKEYLDVVERAFPNMGGDVNNQQAGTITGVVRPVKKDRHIVFFSVVGSAMVVLLIVAVAVLVFRSRMKEKNSGEAEKLLKPNNSA